MKGKYRIIVVEDEAPIRRNLCTKIESSTSRFEISGIFKNGKQALDTIREEQPHVVLTDIKMPLMGGLELTRKIHSHFPEILIAIISGYNDFEYAREAMKYQVTDYLSKPVDIDELRQLLHELEIRLDKTNPDLNRNAEDLLKSRNDLSIVEDICRYLSIHFTEIISIKDITLHFNCPQEYICRIFKKEKNVSLQHYLIEMKIREAKKILRTYDELDIQSVGELVGYPDPYYFSRIFKKYTSLSPMSYRKDYLKEF